MGTSQFILDSHLPYICAVCLSRRALWDQIQVSLKNKNGRLKLAKNIKQIYVLDGVDKKSAKSKKMALIQKIRRPKNV
jgi:hypothetical protein